MHLPVIDFQPVSRHQNIRFLETSGDVTDIGGFRRSVCREAPVFGTGSARDFRNGILIKLWTSGLDEIE